MSWYTTAFCVIGVIAAIVVVIFIIVAIVAVISQILENRDDLKYKLNAKTYKREQILFNEKIDEIEKRLARLEKLHIDFRFSDQI